MLSKAEKVIYSYLPVVILLGLFVLPFRARLQSIVLTSRNLLPKLAQPQKHTPSKPALMSVSNFFKSQRGLLKYDEDGNLVPDLAQGLSVQLNMYLKIKANAQLPDGRSASPSTIKSYLNGISAQGKTDERLKNLIAVKAESNNVAVFTFMPICTGCLELLYEVLGKNVFDPLHKPRFKETIKLITPGGTKYFDTDKLSYLEIEKLAVPLIHDNLVKPDNIKISANNANDYILIKDVIPENPPKNITVIPSTLTKATVLGFNLTNPKFQNRSIRQMVKNTLSGNASTKISASPFSILFVKDDISIANSIAARLNEIGYKVKLVSVNNEWQLIRELRNGYHEAFIITIYETTFDWRYRYFFSGSLPNGEYNNLNFFYFADAYTDRTLEKLDETFDAKERDIIKNQILNRVKEETPCVFLKEQPLCYYLIGQKNDLEKIVDKAHK